MLHLSASTQPFEELQSCDSRARHVVHTFNSSTEETGTGGSL